ncbi:DNA-binding MarR family transcriptional regulator [Homoserinimonas aerilata]|uniref:DNA-binding MarR family transcriptional regulator n=1 Tax=Homoserinimonas aerilata TaxID=1162970 RepID=A0A542YF48_9MICO|nr:MarR family transcriptional regulator [Homoserinimonas aerilata]TQL46718.1 DNA-binding MarR family transcriptional regulator [Homoserinimonas aerilata]
MTNNRAEGPQVPVHESTRLLREFTSLGDEFERYMGRELTVNPTDLQAMQHLIMSGPLSPTEIARRLQISTAAATVVVDRLAKVGHVSRAAHPTDRRGVVVVPAKESVAKAMSTLMPMITGIDEIIGEFDETEKDTITRYLRRVIDVYRSSIPAGDSS